MLEWIQNIMNALGYPGVAFLMFLENVFPPIPSELIMPLAGFTTTQGTLSLAGVIIAGTLGSVLGGLPLYLMGKHVGEERLIRWADTHGGWLALSGDDVRTAKEWFDTHGGKAVFLCRLVPGVRSLISIPAGIARMNIVAFILYTLLGAGLWTGALAYAGVLLSENYEQAERFLGPAAYVILGGLLLAVVRTVWRRKHRA